MKLNQEDRNKLYYNKYKYRASFELFGARFTYWCDSYNDCLKRIKRYMESPWRSYDTDEEIDHDKLQKFLDWREKNKSNVMVRTEFDRISVFSNQKEIIKTVRTIDKNAIFTEANVIASQVLFFENEPEHKFRVYLKGIRLTNNHSDSICSFIERYENSPTIRISPALVNAVRSLKIHTKRWLHNSYFIDYTDESTLTLIKLLLDNLISPKVYKLDSNANKDKYSNNMECLHGQDS